MTATLFQMGFRSGGFQPLPMRLGFSAADITGITARVTPYVKEAGDLVQLFQGKTPAPTTPLVPPPVAAPQGTILGLPSSTVMIGGALLLGGGVLAAVLLSKK